MPTYTYRCKDCEHQFEARQRMSETPLTVCPVCSGRIRRVVNSVGIVFKGSGFYVTDNRNGNSANGSGKPAPPPPSDAKKESSPTEPAKSSEPKAPSSSKSETSQSKTAEAKAG